MPVGFRRFAIFSSSICRIFVKPFCVLQSLIIAAALVVMLGLSSTTPAHALVTCVSNLTSSGSNGLKRIYFNLADGSCSLSNQGSGTDKYKLSIEDYQLSVTGNSSSSIQFAACEWEVSDTHASGDIESYMTNKQHNGLSSSAVCPSTATDKQSAGFILNRDDKSTTHGISPGIKGEDEFTLTHTLTAPDSTVYKIKTDMRMTTRTDTLFNSRGFTINSITIEGGLFGDSIQSYDVDVFGAGSGSGNVKAVYYEPGGTSTGTDNVIDCDLNAGARSGTCVAPVSTSGPAGGLRLTADRISMHSEITAWAGCDNDVGTQISNNNSTITCEIATPFSATTTTVTWTPRQGQLLIVGRGPPASNYDGTYDDGTIEVTQVSTGVKYTCTISDGIASGTCTLPPADEGTSYHVKAIPDTGGRVFGWGDSCPVTFNNGEKDISVSQLVADDVDGSSTCLVRMTNLAVTADTPDPTASYLAPTLKPAFEVQNAELQIDVFSIDSPIVAGQVHTVNLRVRHARPSATVLDAVVDVALPDGTLVEFGSGSPCGDSEPPRCEIHKIDGSLKKPGDVHVIVLKFQFPSDLPKGAYPLTAVLSSASIFDPVLGNNTHTENISVEVPQADLSVAMAGNPHPDVTAGSDLTYTVTVNNTAGPHTAENVVATLTLPAGVSLKSTPSSFSCQYASPELICDLGDIDHNGEEEFTVTVKVDDTVTPPFTTQVAVSSDTNDPATGNNTDDVETSLTIPNADLSVGVAVSPDPALSGRRLTYTVEVTNETGSDPVGDVAVNFTLPSGVTFVETSAECDDQTDDALCELGSFADGDTRSFDVLVDVDPATTGSLTFVAQVTSSANDTITGNDSHTETTTVNAPRAELTISMSDDVDPIVAGNPLTYTVTVNNAGPQTAENVVA
ncbi:MAG: DUF11 domain-containing protein, partial [Rhizobiaceae bacterium]|nr:DUF11 domain-containing protein [Rhizobiaceae bacterium]